MNEAICDLMLSFMHFTLYAVDVGNKLPGPSLSSSIVQSEHFFFLHNWWLWLQQLNIAILMKHLQPPTHNFSGRNSELVVSFCLIYIFR